MPPPRGRRDWPDAYPYRSVGDLDLLGQGDPTPARIAAIFKSLCGLTVQDDGVVYDGESVRTESAREDQDNRGVRVTLTATLAKTRLALQI
jgi:hypothetical protein